jgi:signal transduction histidine kinase
MLFLILVFILKASALFFEKQASNHSSHLIETFLRSNQEVLEKDVNLLERKIDQILEHPSVIEVKIFNAYDGLVFIREKNADDPGSFLFKLDPVVMEKKLDVNGTLVGKLRVTTSTNEESGILQTFALTLLAIFVVFSVFFFLFIRNYNKGVNKELLLLKDSIEKKVEVEALQTREFNIEELALIQRKIKNDSKDLRFLKEELEKKENLALIGNFASSIVHDIRNPLSVIEGYTDLLRVKIPDKERKYAEKIFDSTTMIERLLEDILKFVSEQKLELKMRKVKPKKVIQSALQFLEAVITEKSVSIAIEVETENSLRCDIDRLSRAIANLVKNSIEISQAGDFITVKALEKEDSIVFSVRDTGTGIPEAIRDTIFEPFATANKRKGTGLGLFIVKSIITAHNGTITFETGSSGTEFFIKIPSGY